MITNTTELALWTQRGRILKSSSAGDRGFCRADIMVWGEDNDVDFIRGLARNSRLAQEISKALARAHALYQGSGQAARVFKNCCYKTLDTWMSKR